MSGSSTINPKRAQALFLLVVAGLALFVSGSRAAIPPAGQFITSRSEAIYVNENTIIWTNVVQRKSTYRDRYTNQERVMGPFSSSLNPRSPR